MQQTNLNIVLDRIFEKIKVLFKDEDTGHDIGHLKRVLNNALTIQEKEGGDKYVISVSALVHDVHRLMAHSLGRFVSPKESIPEVEKILWECDVDSDKIYQILETVKYHENKKAKNIPIEWQVLQDADALDALGTIGLKRTLKYCKTKNIPIVNKNYSLDCKQYVPDINPISTCHYISRTMIPNGENMHTATGQKMANRRIKILKDFVDSKLAE